MNDYRECLDLVLKSEGGWVNNPKDPGGETNLGVTKAVWEEYVGHPVQTMKNLTKDDVAPLYEQKYWKACYGEVLPRGLDFIVFSMGVNAGPGRSLICASNTATLINKFSEVRREYYRSLKTFPIFGKGWLSRVDHEEATALEMAKNG